LMLRIRYRHKTVKGEVMKRFLMELKSFVLFTVLLSGLTDAATISDGYSGLRFDHEGRPSSLRLPGSGEEWLKPNDSGRGVEVDVRDRSSARESTLRMNHVSVDEGRLTAFSGDLRLVFELIRQDGYLVFRLAEVEEPDDMQILRARIDLNFLKRTAVYPLDPMTKPYHSEKSGLLEWSKVWGRSAANPPGAIAIFPYETDEEHDETLLRLWANGWLPHSKVDGEWTVERARKWLAEWQARFADQSTMVIKAGSPEELYALAGEAKRWGMKKVYLHTDTWRGEYWPVRYSFLHLNPEVFPNGEEDFSRFGNFLATNGLELAIHTVSATIANYDPDYVDAKPDPRLAAWVAGELDGRIDEAADTIQFKPAPGQTFPQEIGHEYHGPGMVRRWLDIKCLQIGDELIRVGSFDNTDGRVWTARRCQRGLYNTAPAKHAAGSAVRGLLRPYNMGFTADSDSSLLEELARRYAEFCNRNGVTHLELDGIEIHDDKPWGPAKFSAALYRHMNRPVTSNTSSGEPMPFHIEYWFKSSAQVVCNHVHGGAAGGGGVPLLLHHEDRPATGPYEMHLKISEMAGGGGQTFGLMKPIPMFGISENMLQSFGLRDYLKESLVLWREAAFRMTDAQRAQIKNAFFTYRSPQGGGGGHAAADVLWRAEKKDGQLAIIPFSLMPRTSGCLPWSWGQEFGPLVPRLYIRTGETLELNNRFGKQEPEFVIRVMHAPGDAMASETSGGASSEDSQILEDYNRGAGQAQTEHPLAEAKHVWAEGAVRQGEANTGTTCYRRAFTIKSLRDVSQALLTFHADDLLQIWINGRELFTGGAWNVINRMSIDASLQLGTNVIAIQAINEGGAGCMTAALRLEEDGQARVLRTDRSWKSSTKVIPGWQQPGFDDTGWGGSVELADFGASVWPRVDVTPVSFTRDLTPEVAEVSNVQEHRFSDAGDGIRIRFENKTAQEYINADNLPRWNRTARMEGARGIRLTVTGDDSGAVLVLQVIGRGRRDYVVPINFKGTRTIEIPSGEAAWSEPAWGWSSQTAHMRYSSISQIRLGFGRVPAKTAAEVVVENIEILPESASRLENPVIHAGTGWLEIQGSVPSDHYLWFRGGDTVGLYDLNWNRVATLPVQKKSFEVGSGGSPICIDSDQQRVWVEAQFFTKGAPLLIP
jgi:hypothetical protein